MDAQPSAQAGGNPEEFAGDEDEIDDPPLPPPLSNPPASHPLLTKTYDSLEEIIDALNAFAASAGFATTRKGASNLVDGLGPTFVVSSAPAARCVPWQPSLEDLQPKSRIARGVAISRLLNPMAVNGLLSLERISMLRTLATSRPLMASSVGSVLRCRRL